MFGGIGSRMIRAESEISSEMLCDVVMHQGGSLDPVKM